MLSGMHFDGSQGSLQELVREGDVVDVRYKVVGIYEKAG
jgi:hypothetical protein